MNEVLTVAVVVVAPSLATIATALILNFIYKKVKKV